jgi:hypothetical protein
LIALNVLDSQIAARAIGDELLFVVAFQGIAEHKVVSHEAIERWPVAISDGLHPLFIHVPQVLLDLEGAFRLCAHFAERFYDRLCRESTARIHRILFGDRVG